MVGWLLACSTVVVVVVVVVVWKASITRPSTPIRCTRLQTKYDPVVGAFRPARPMGLWAIL